MKKSYPPLQNTLYFKNSCSSQIIYRLHVKKKRSEGSKWKKKGISQITIWPKWKIMTKVKFLSNIFANNVISLQGFTSYLMPVAL